MENPHMQEQVLEVLDKLRPFLLRDGGDVELVDIEEGIVNYALWVHAEAAQVLQSH